MLQFRNFIRLHLSALTELCFMVSVRHIHVYGIGFKDLTITYTTLILPDNNWLFAIEAFRTSECSFFCIYALNFERNTHKQELTPFVAT